jgi:hypothetical protein
LLGLDVSEHLVDVGWLVAVAGAEGGVQAEGVFVKRH